MGERIGSWVSLDVPLAQATSSQHAGGFPGGVWFSRLPLLTALARCYGVGKPPDPLLIDNYIPPSGTGPFPAPFSPAATPSCAQPGLPLDKCPTGVTSAGGVRLGEPVGKGRRRWKEEEKEEEGAPFHCVCPTATSQGSSLA